MTASIAAQRRAVGSSFRLIGVHRSLPMLCQKANSASIEAHEGLASPPLALVGDDPISEVSTLLQYSKPRFTTLTVHCDLEIGRAACREGVSQSVSITEVGEKH